MYTYTELFFRKVGCTRYDVSWFIEYMEVMYVMLLPKSGRPSHGIGTITSATV
jgi:hypothetical protein